MGININDFKLPNSKCRDDSFRLVLCIHTILLGSVQSLVIQRVKQNYPFSQQTVGNLYELWKKWSFKLLIYQESRALLKPLRSYQINNFWQKTMGCLCFSFYSKTNLSPVCSQTLAGWDCVHSRVYEDVRLYWQWRLFGLRLQRLSGWYSCYIVHSCNDYCLFAAQSFCCSIGWRHGNALWLEVLT